jgi:hypothetical protein
MSMIINVEFVAGTDINSAVSQAKQKASQWGVSYVCFNFNGISFSIGCSADIESVINQYTRHNKDEIKYGIVSK